MCFEKPFSVFYIQLKSQALNAHKFNLFFLSNFNMTTWPPSKPVVGSLRFSLFNSLYPIPPTPFLQCVLLVPVWRYAISPISRKHSRNMTSLLIYPSIFRG